MTDQKSLKANDDHPRVFLVDCICTGSDGDMGNSFLSCNKIRHSTAQKGTIVNNGKAD